MFKQIVLCILLCNVYVVITKKNLISDNPCKDFDHLYVTIEGSEVHCRDVRPFKSVDIVNPPLIRYPEANKEKLYLLLIFDPDVCGTKLHYLEANVKAEDLKTGHTSGGYLMAGYKEPSPEKVPHRYFIYAFEQFIVLYPPQILSRCGFNVEKFVLDNSLTAKAVNMFKIERK